MVTKWNSKHIRTIWTVDYGSWLKRDQLDVTCFIISLFTAQNVSDVNTSILKRLRLICWVISWVVLLWFDVCWCYVVVWLWWCGIRMQAEACIRSWTDATADLNGLVLFAERRNLVSASVTSHFKRGLPNNIKSKMHQILASFPACCSNIWVCVCVSLQ